MDIIESATLMTRPASGSLLPSVGPCREAIREELGAMVWRALGGQRQEGFRWPDGPRMATTQMSGDLQGVSPPSHRSSAEHDEVMFRKSFTMSGRLKRRFPLLALVTDRCAPRVGCKVHEIGPTEYGIGTGANVHVG
jgi:hypothetical protein